jgi:hypothetical protein
MKKLIVPRRQLLKAAVLGIAAPYVRRVDAAAAFGGFMVAGTNAFPGLPGNPVGAFASTVPVLTSSPTVHLGGTPGSPSGSIPALTNGHTYAYYDQDSFSGDYTMASVSNITFVGCRFQSNNLTGANVTVQNTCSNITFSYCTLVPRTAVVSSIPNAAWPAASAGQGIDVNNQAGKAPYQIVRTQGYQYGFNLLAAPITIDHCDMWGWGNAIQIAELTAGVTITDNWIHDARHDGSTSTNDGGFLDHTDGPGYLASNVGCSNVTVKHNTIAAIGNTHGIAFQNSAPGTTAFSNLTLVNNYLSGFGNCSNPGGGAPISNVTHTDNIFGTDLPPSAGYIYGFNFTTQFTATTNIWRRNQIKIGSGGTPLSGGFDGAYVWPDTTFNHVSDFTG